MNEVSEKKCAFTRTTMKEKLKNVVTASLDLLFPPSCPYCKEMTGDNNRLLCRECFSRLKFIKTPYCSCCGKVFLGSGDNHLCGVCLKSSWAFDKARSFFIYEEITAKLIHDLKYSGKTTGISTFRWLSEQSDVLDDLKTPDFILPVPLHRKRLQKRGFNQALILARSLFPEEKEKIRHDILLRKVDTPTQAGLSGIERRKNLKNAFAVEKSPEVAGKKVLIMDDVFTTGSTLNECAKVLKAAGCTNVEALTICLSDKFIS